MQPVQLSLMPEEFPAPPVMIFPQLPEPQITAAVALLADLIVKAAAGKEAAGHE